MLTSQFYLSVELGLMTYYRLAANGQTICEVEVECPAWLPVRPKINSSWLRSLVRQAIRSCLSKRVVRA